jgi:hypothetical protein
MNQDHPNPTIKVFFKIIATLAVIALILSASRLFLSTSDRQASEFYTYNLNVSSQMIAYLSVVVMAILAIVIGSFLMKDYDVIGTPLLFGGLLPLIFMSILGYLSKYSGLLSGYRQGVDPVVEFVLTMVIAIDWIMLIVYAWRSYPGKSVNKIESGTVAPPGNQNSPNLDNLLPH